MADGRSGLARHRTVTVLRVALVVGIVAVVVAIVRGVRRTSRLRAHLSKTVERGPDRRARAQRTSGCDSRRALRVAAAIDGMEGEGEVPAPAASTSTCRLPCLTQPQSTVATAAPPASLTATVTFTVGLYGSRTE